jgi:type I site-specific restriction endonuclease
MSNFAFLAAEFPAVHEAAVEAERQAGVSPTAAAFFAGKAVEVAVKWAFRTDPGLKLPYQDNISALLHEPSFRRAAGEAVFAKAKRVLFLADRVALVNQAAGAFKAHLPDAAPVNLVTERTSDGRVFLSTYPTMMNLIDGKQEGKAKFGPGHFDLIVIDEAHRSVYQRFRAIFEYFDSFLVGLTATPKDEIDKNTYSLFDLEDGVPTDAYSLDEAVADGWLVPPMAISVPLKIVRSGLRYADLTEEEKDQWDMLEWGEDEIPDSVEAAEVNKRLFNEDTVDRVIAHSRLDHCHSR